VLSRHVILFPRDETDTSSRFLWLLLACADKFILACAYKQGDHTFRWGIYDRAPLKTWSTDRITLLGDAAHAVTPHLGQGANQAVEDAITLAVLLQDAQAADVPVRLRRYEDLRIERTRQVHDGPREAGALYRSTELSPGQQAERIVAINNRLQLDTHDAERIANDALSAL
jgi:salicylate hydroxylase